MSNSPTTTTTGTTSTTSTSTSTKKANADVVDVRGPRFAAWVTTAVLVTALILAAASPRAAAALLGVQAAIFAIGAVGGPRRHPGAHPPRLPARLQGRRVGRAQGGSGEHAGSVPRAGAQRTHGGAGACL